MLVFVFMSLKAVAYWLDRYGLVFSSRSKFTGASYTDVHASLQSKTILFWIAILIALGVLASMWLRSALLPGIGFGVLLILSILISGIYPAIVQQVSVKPNASDQGSAVHQAQHHRDPAGLRHRHQHEADAERIGDVQGLRGDVQPVGRGDHAHRHDGRQHPHPRPERRVTDSHERRSGSRTPYGFAANLDMDRYTTADGVEHDYVVGVRELVPANLKGSQGNWINSHTVYTHGYGFVAAEADKDVTNGKTSDYTEGEIPPVGPARRLTTPQVYYGELMNEYSIVGAKGSQREYDGADSRTTYKGKGGVLARQLRQPARVRRPFQADELPAQQRGELHGREDHLQPRSQAAGGEGRAVPHRRR